MIDPHDSPTLPPSSAHEAATLPPSPLDTTPHQEAAVKTLPNIPGFSLESELGRGGMGVVYLARQVRLNRLVALKMILSADHADADTRLRFLHEAETIAKLQHPGIVQVYEFGTHENNPYFALEYISGGSLDKKLAGTPLPPREAATLIEKLARAVQAAHDQGIIHRDLKPANILLGSPLPSSGEGSGVRGSKHGPLQVVPKITDFGLVKQEGSDMTATGAILGTPSYMAPEQADGKKNVGPAADIYALGAIFYECLTGRPPFKAATPLDTILQVVSDDPVSIRQLQAKTPVDLETICHKCLQKDPAKRYRSADELAEDLGRYLKGEPIHARPVSSMERAVKWVKRHRTLTVATLSTAAALLVGLGVALANEAKANAERDEKEVQRKLAVEFRDQALDALRAMTGEDVEKLLAGRKELASNERAYLEAIASRWQTFAKREGRDEVSRALQAEGYYQVANLLHRLGQQIEARPLYEKAIFLWEKLVEECPATPNYRHELANSNDSMGTLLHDLRDQTGARNHYLNAITIENKLVAEFPAVRDYKWMLAGSLHNMGQVLCNSGNLPSAKEHYEKAISIQEILVAEYPDARYRNFLANHHNSLGTLLSHSYENNIRTEAKYHYQKAVVIREKLISEFPAVSGYHQYLANDYHGLAKILHTLVDYEASQVYYQKSLAIREKTVSEFPSVPQCLNSLASTRCGWATLLAARGQYKTAKEEYKKALITLEDLATKYSRFPTYRHNLATTHALLGSLLSNLDERKASCEHYQKACVILEKLITEFSAVPSYQIDLGGNYCNIGGIVKGMGEITESLAWYDKAIVTLRDVHAAEPRNSAANWNLIQSYYGRAMAFEMLGKNSEAIKDWNCIITLTSVIKQKNLRELRVIALAKVGEITRAIAEFVDLTNTNEASLNANEWYNCAWVYALASSKDETKIDEYAALAMKLLRNAVKSGFKDIALMKKDKVLDPLRKRDDFKKILDSLEKQ